MYRDDNGHDGRAGDRVQFPSNATADPWTGAAISRAPGSANSQSFELEAPSDGLNELVIRYANGWPEERGATLCVDGSNTPEQLSFPPTGGWSSFSTIAVQLHLTAGYHRLAIASPNNSGPQVTAISVGEILQPREPNGAGLAMGAGMASIAAVAVAQLIEASEAEAAPQELQAVPPPLPEGEPPAEEQIQQAANEQEADGDAAQPAQPQEDETNETEEAPGAPRSSSGRIFEGSGEFPGPSGGTPQIEDPVDLNVPPPAPQLRQLSGAGSSGSSGVAAFASAPPVVDEDFPASGQILIQGEAGELSLVDASTTGAFTTIRNPRNPETSGLRPGYSGSGYLDFGDTGGDTATYSFSLTQAGSYTFHFRYASNGARPLDLLIDGAAASTLPFPTTDPDAGGPLEGFDHWLIQTFTITLDAGVHTFSLSIPAGAIFGPNIDAIAITAEGGTPDFSAPNSLPEIADGAFTVVEGELPVGTLTAQDVDGDEPWFFLPDNPATDNALFTIDQLTGVIAFKAAPDFENPQSLAGGNVYTLQVEAQDGTGSSFKTVTVTVGDDPSDNEAPDATADAGGDLAMELVDLSDPANAVFSVTGNDADIVSFVVSVNGQDAQTVTLSAGTFIIDLSGLAPGDASIGLTVTDGAGNTATAQETVTIVPVEEPEDFVPFVIQAEDGSVVDASNPAGAPGNNDTQVRDADNPETPASGKTLGPDNLRLGYTGSGYVDYGLGNGSAGDAVTLTFDVPAAGAYTLHIRYANGGGSARPLALSVNGADEGQLPFAAPGNGDAYWNMWQVQTVDVTLDAGSNTIVFAIPSNSLTGPNIDAAAITEVGGEASFLLPVFTSDVAVDVVEGTTLALDVDASDGDGNALTYSLTGNGADAALFSIDAATGQLSFIAASDFEDPADAGSDNVYEIEVAVSDGWSTVTQTVSVTVTNDAGDDVNTPTGLVFDASTLTSYSTQDTGPGATVSGDGSTLSLDGNLWKRAPLGQSYTITQGTKLVLEVTLGANLSELVAVGFDNDDFPFEMSDGSVYQIAGTEQQGAFIDLRSGNPGTPGSTFTVTIDLSAHAGKTISSLVFVADDDYSGNGTGSVSFSNVELVEGESEPGENSAPAIVGGGIADLTVPERSDIEIDMPFLDADGDAITYSLSVTDGGGNPVPGFEGLTFDQGTLSGTIDAAPSATPYTVTITADDGNGGVTSTSFLLTVEDVNDAPVVNPGVAFEPYFGAVGEEISGIDLALFADAFSDVDGDTLTFTAEGLPAGLSVNGEGVIVGTPLEAGDGTITIVATDPEGLRAELELELIIDGPSVGDVTVIEGEAFNGIGEADGFYVAAVPGASGNQVIRAGVNESASVSTLLSANGLSEGWYEVSITVFDETDGTASFSLMIGDTPLATGLTFDEAGTFDNPAEPRGNGGQVGNLKTITFTTPVFIDAETIATISGQSDAGEYLRIDKLTFTRVEEPLLPPVGLALDVATVDENVEGGVIGTLSASDPDGDASTLTYATDDARFVIDGDQLRLADGVSLDHEVGETVTVSVTATDSDGLSTTGDLTITVGDVNEAPVLSDTAAIDDVELIEGTAQSIDLAAALGATDEDEGATVSYGAHIAGGAPLPDGMAIVAGVLQIGETVAAGTYAIEVFASDSQLDSESVFFTVTVAEPGTEPPFDPVVIQAEIGAIASDDPGNNETITTVRDPGNPESNPNLPTGLRPGFTGTGYVDFGDTAGDTVSYTITVPTAGVYEFAIRYATNTDRPLDFAVNSGVPVQLPFLSTDPDGAGEGEGFDNWLVQTVTVELQAGANSFSLAIPAGASTGPNIDSITITRPQTGDTSADADDVPLFLSGPQDPLNETEAASINFNIAGVDSDIVRVEVSFDGGATRVEVFPDADGDFTIDGSALDAGDQTATVYVTDEADNEASSSMDFVVEGEVIVIEAETFTPDDATGTGNQVTQARTAENPEPNTPLEQDADGDGLWDGFTGTGYLDMGAQIGDAAEFTVDVPAAGTYILEFRYANGGGGDNGDRPMTLTVGGETVTVSFPGTGVGGWSNWATATVEIELTAGANTVRLENTVANGPNIDNVTITRDGSSGEPTDPREKVYFEEVVKINFEPAPSQTTQGLPTGYETPDGYLADTGLAFGDRGNGFSYGWVTEESVADGTANGTIAANQPANAHWYKTIADEASELQKTYAHMEFPGAGAGGSRAWEMALEDGTYQVTISVGDTAGAFDSNYVINVEGESFMPSWVPANPIDGSQSGGGFRSTLVTGMATVTDGRLTIDSIGGTNTEIQYLEIERVADLTPGDGRTADLDYSFFTAPVAASLEDGQVSIAIGPDGQLPSDIDPTASFVIGVNLQAEGNRGPNIAYVEQVKLIETLTGEEVAINVQISGGADSLTIRPLQELKENTSYTLKVQDVLDLGSVTDSEGELRQFQDLTTTFVTGEAPEDVPREVAFTTDVILNGFSDGAGGYTSIEFGPDGKLYVATITGEIHRWSVNSDGTIDKASQETLSLDYLDTPTDRRGIVGFVFDPEDPNTIWITDNAPIPRESKAFNTPEFSGRVSKITLGEGGSFEDATAEAYITGLPRSGGDHLSNSLEFRTNPNAGEPGEPDYLLYLTQGSNSAAGAPDNAWGNRPERLLNAAILEIDPTRDAPEGGFDVRTEPIDGDDVPTTSFPASAFNEDGTYPGMYNPFAEDAVLKIYATGVRNAYDLVWHSNGHLYVPTNGTASGGKTPQDPSQPGLDTVISNSPKQYDYFFTVDEGGYYGHPNALRDEYILNGGNPTAGLDPNEVVGGNDGNPSTDGYQTGVQVDENYDYDGVYNLGYNQSPNGATEYTGNAFGSNLKGAILFAQFSTGDNVRVIRVDAEGNIIGDDVLRRPDGSVIDDYIDPLDIIENPLTGQLYLMTLNRGTGASQLVLLTPAPGGVTQDLSANEGGDLVLVPVDVSDPENAVFQVNGLDDDITALRIAFNGGPKTTIELDGQNRFTFDVSTLQGEVTATLEVTDDDLNTATVDAQFTPGEEPGEPTLVSLVTIQAEDQTPGDGTQVTVPTGASAQIQIRDASNPETGSGEGYVDGLRPGAVGLDGNTDNLDGTPGGYADFGSTNADFITFTFDVPSDNAGASVLRFRYSNGGSADRPLQLEVNGSIVTVQSFTPTGGTGIDGWTVWSTVEVPVSLVAGQNSVTLRAVEATGPNIDQLEVLVQEATQTPPNDGEVIVDGVTYLVYEAENADLGGALVVTEDRNQSGDAFVDFDGTGDQTISWTISVAEAGTYGLDFLYALATTKIDRPMALSVNGTVVETLPFARNSDAGETIWGPQGATVDLAAGENTITLTAPDAVGPNVDLLRVTKEPISTFEPDHADIVGSGRIELEADDGSANTVNGSIVDFYLTVDADGIYKLDVAANSDASDGQGLTWFLNGVEIDESAFPDVGEAGEESVYVELTAGTQYQVRLVSDAPGANGIDYLDIQPAPGNANADIGIESLDAAYLPDRLHFSYIENPDAVTPGSPRDFKDTGTVRISNTGTETLEILEAELSGPFQLANPSIFEGLTLGAGEFVDVEVLFDRSSYTPPTSNVDGTSTVFTGELKLRTNDADSPTATVDLAGFWQARDEGGQEPNVNEIWSIFGFGNRIENLSLIGGGEDSALNTNDVFAQTDETEVLSPYWRIADGYTEAKITQIAAFHGTGGASLGIHNPGSKGAQVGFWNHEGTDNQRLLPNSGDDATFSTRTFTNADIPNGWTGSEVFGISVAGLSTDPRLNPEGGVDVPGAQQGHTVKVFQAFDADGNVIPNVFLGIMDYTGINYDYNDNLFVIEGVTPVGFGQEIAVEGLDDAAADDRLVFTSIDNPANGQQNFRNEATFTISNDGFAPLEIESIVLSDPSAFEIVGTAPTSIPAGGSAQVTVRFIGQHSGTAAGAELMNATLTITSDAMSAGETVIQLAGLAQEFSENGSEPTVAQIVEAFGYGTDMAQGGLANGGIVETIGDEVLMPYLQRLDGSQPVEVIQLAAFLQQNNVARLGFHGLAAGDVTNLFAQDDQEYQTVLPSEHMAGPGAGGGVARGEIDHDGPFGLFVSVDGRPTYASWSDPQANRIDPDFGQLVGEDQGHLIRFFQALDAEGNVIEGTYIAIQDYPGAGNYDYNDHMFVIKNVQPYALTSADDADGDGVNDALQDDADNDGTVDFFDPDTDPGEPGEGERGDYVLGVNFGGGAIADDPVLGVALVGQDDPRVSLAGSINPGAGVDAPGNPNGAGATPGSAFATYEDGSDWTATIDVPNGTYIVVLHTQETYWNAAGQRQFDISVNGQQVVSNLDAFAQAGGDAPIAIETVVTVTNGEIVIDLSADIDNAPLNAVTIYEYVEPGSSQQPFSGSPVLVDADGAVIDADAYDEGGQGVAYNDAAGLQGGSNGGRVGSDVEVTGGGDIGWIEAGEWLEYTVNLEEGGEYDLGLLLSNGGGAGRSATVSFYRSGETTPYATSGPIANPETASWSSFVNRTADGIQLEAGEQVVRVTFAGGSQDFRSFSLTPVVTQTPYGGETPGFTAGTLTVDATNFDNGGQGIAYSDDPGLDNPTSNPSFRPGRDVEFVGAELDIGHVEPGEWVEYTIDVPASGMYSFSVNAKTPVTGATIAVSLGAGAALGVITLADGHAAGSNFSSAAFEQSDAISIPLSAGIQTLRLSFDGPLASNGYVLDLRSFTLEQEGAQTPLGGTAPVLGAEGLTIDGVAYDEGGQDVAYNDTAGLEGGSNGGRAGSDVEVTGGGDIGWIADGEWLEYTIDVETAGTYFFNLSMAVGQAGGPDRSVTASFTNGADVETVTVDTPRTGSWSSFEDSDTVAVDLAEGVTVVRLIFNGGSQDLSSFSLTPAPQGAMALAAMDRPASEPIFDEPQPVDLPEDTPPGDSFGEDDGSEGSGHLFGYDMLT